MMPGDKNKPLPKPETQSQARSFRRRLRWVTAIVLLLIAASGVYTLWRSVGPRVIGLPQFIVAAEDVHITPPPKWIRTDVRAEVVREINLAGPISILDEELGERFYEAFAAHPWVAKVSRVIKRPPAAVDVELVYRRPVLMVQVTDGLLPVDADGVQLLTADFSPLEAMRYPRLVDVGRETPPPAGTRWSDARVVAAASLAAALIDAWQELGLHHLALARQPPPSAAGPFQFELFTKEGTCVLWGAAPNSDGEGQAATADKLSRLRKYHADHNSLEGSRGPQTIDLRVPHGVPTSPRTAERPPPRDA
ncbi:MAG TPA: hypothetical protein VG826_01485 [Pirellulales bacterium]|nr:hypothetical protein [Pirellulales bacterium]